MKRAFPFLMLLLLAVGLLFPPAEAVCQENADKLPMSTTWGLFHARDAAGDGRIFAVLTVAPAPGWSFYSNAPGDMGRPTELAANLGDGVRLPVAYPEGKTKAEGSDPDAVSEIYDGPTPLLILLPADVRPPFTLNARLSLLLCSDTRCLPVDENLIFSGAGFTPDKLPSVQDQPWRRLAEKVLTGASSGASDPEDAQLAPQYLHPGLEVTGLLPALLFGLLAGLILNAMPCVLPVVTLKVNALLAGASAEQDHHRRRLFREHNLFFAAGVLVYFLFLSALLGFTGMSWGAVFQRSGAVMALTALVFGLSLSLLGVFNLPVVDMKFARASNDRPRSQAFFTGLLATLLATPCSGPFLGGVLGWALVQPPVVIAAVFAAIGLGMAAPYLVLAAAPGLVRFVPKPGAWTEYLERAVGFFLLGTCIYLMSILPEKRLIAALTLLWATGLAAWIWGMADPSLSTTKRAGLRLLAAAIVAGGLLLALSPPRGQDLWRQFDQESFQAELGETPILVEFTADWCPTCKLLEKTVYTPRRMQRLQQTYDLLLIKADLTESQPEAQRLLERLGGRSIPAAAIFPSGKNASRPLVLRDLFSASQLETALEQTLGRK
ncbi:MAG: cytochrome c biogenesis protein CcdA [Desulfovibrionaceae bacterium]